MATPAEALKSLAAGALCGALHVAPVSGAFFAFILAYLSPLPLLLVGLQHGAGAALTATAAAALVINILLGGLAVILFMILFGLPVVMMVRYALAPSVDGAGQQHWPDPGTILAGLSAYAAGLYTLVVLAFLVTETSLSTFLAGHLADVWVRMGATTARGELVETLHGVGGRMPALIGMSWLIMVSVNAVLAQSVLKRLDASRRPSPVFASLGLPRWAGHVVMVAAVASIVPLGGVSLYAQTVLFIFAVPFMIVGLAVIHAVSRGWDGRWMILTAIYGLTVVLTFPLILIALLGMIDHWFHLRRRVAP